MAFIFGGNTPWTYDELKRQRELANMLATDTAAPRNVGEGLNAIGNALAYRGITKRAGKEEARMKGDFDQKWGTVFGGGSAGVAQSGPSYGGAPLAPADPSSPTGLGDDAMAALGKKPIRDYRESLIGTESGGKWSAQNAETGAGGKKGHFGRVQFGQARLQEAMNAGVIPQGTTPEQFMASPDLQMAAEDWHFMDLESQLADLVGREVNGQPMDIGALVAMGHLGGAGGARKFVESGGAYNPADSFGTSLADYARKHGGTVSPFSGAPQGNSGGMNLGALVELAGDPMATPAQRAIVEQLIAQQTTAADPMKALELEKAQLEIEAMRNPVQDPMEAVELEKAQIELARLKNPEAEIPKTLQERTALAREAGIAEGTPEYQKYIATGELVVPEGGSEYGLTPVLGRDKDGNVVVMQLGKDGTAVQTQMPDGVTADLGLAAEVKAEGAAVGKAKGEDEALLSSTESKLGGLETVVAELEGLADQATYTMGGQLYDAGRAQLGMEPRAAAVARAEYIAKVDNQVLPMLRDTFGAAFTVKEGETLRATLGDPDKSPQEKKAVLRAFIEQKKRDVEALRLRTGESPEAAAGPTSITSDAEYDALPSGTLFVGPDGKTRRKP